ncbi:MAG: hypothetical protein MJ232_08690 [archaeon]|nr:hypothetical protein [archaeon]
MRKEQMTIEVKNGRSYETTRTEYNKEEIYKSLADDLLHKKIHKCTYITSIKDRCNYDGTRTIITTYNNAVRHIYIIED